MKISLFEPIDHSSCFKRFVGSDGAYAIYYCSIHNVTYKVFHTSVPKDGMGTTIDPNKVK